MNPTIGHNGGPDIEGRKESMRTTWAKALFADPETPVYVMAMAWVIHWYSKHDGTGAALSNQQFEAICGISHDTANRGKRWLRDHGYIELQVGSGTQKTRFRMALPGQPVDHGVRTERRGDTHTAGTHSAEGTQPADGATHTADPGVRTQRTNNLYRESIGNPDSGGRAEDGQSFWQHAFGQSSDSVSFVNGKLTLLNGTRVRWLNEFGGDEKRLDLALIQISPVIQPNSNRSLGVQVEAQLARIAADKIDRDTRYANAAKTNKPPPSVNRWAKAVR